MGKPEKGVVIADLEIGAVIEGTVQRITPYGAFIALEGGKVGLVHISEIDRNYVRSVEDYLHVNDSVSGQGRRHQGRRQDRPVDQGAPGPAAERPSPAGRATPSSSRS